MPKKLGKPFQRFSLKVPTKPLETVSNKDGPRKHRVKATV